MMFCRVTRLAAVALGAVFAPLSAFAGERGPVVVELYTSQACPFSPAADAYLAELAEADDVIALTMPVGYWDYTGWQDTLALPENAERQKAYTKVLGNKRVYTPQMVINGASDVRAAKRNPKKIEAALDAPRPAAVFIAREGESLEIDLPALAETGEAVVWLAPFEAKPIEVSIKAGENKGRKLTYKNVVKGMRQLAVVTGDAQTLTASLSGEEASLGCAVLVQAGGVGPVVAAGRCP